MLFPSHDATCKKHCHSHSASTPGRCESSIAQFLNQIIPSADFPHSKMSNSCLTQPNTYIEPLNNTSRMLHSTFGSSAAFCFLLHSYAAAPRPIFHTQTPFLSRRPAKGRVLKSISCCYTDHSLFAPAKPVPAVTQHDTSSTFERKNAISSSQRST